MIVDVNGLTIKYRDLIAVDNISFQVQEGEILGIIGPNGAGKTSALECIEGLRKATSGKMLVSGISPENRQSLYTSIGVQLQEASFPDMIKVEEVCRLFSSFYSEPTDYNALLERFNLSEKRKLYVKKLSGGQKQRLSIIVALIANPKVIFLDELTTGLDPAARKDMWELIKSMRDEGRTIIMTTHYMEEAEYLCNRVMVMVKGKIVASGTVKELIEQADIKQRITYNSNEGCKDDLMKIDNVSNMQCENGKTIISGTGKNLLRDVTMYLTSNNIPFENLTNINPGLEDVYFHFTGHLPEVN